MPTQIYINSSSDGLIQISSLDSIYDKASLAYLAYNLKTTGYYYLSADTDYNSFVISNLAKISYTPTTSAPTTSAIYNLSTDTSSSNVIGLSATKISSSSTNTAPTTSAIYNLSTDTSSSNVIGSSATKISSSSTNTAPTSANKIITINEDTAKVLTLTDFIFSDTDANSILSKVKVSQLETKGTLKLNGIDVFLNQEILASDIKAGKLIFTPTSNEFGTSYSNFKFQVSDGTLYSTSSYSTIFNVTQEVDTLSKSTTYGLSSLIENLILTGTSAINGTGNTLDNTIIGNSANNTLSGLSGNDTLNGGVGADIMIGGAGNDIYYIDNSGDKVYETDAGGIDKVNSSISYTLTSSFVENLTLTGTSAINGTGSTLNNTIIGNSANNTLNGALGNDILIGGTGKDVFVFNSKLGSTNIDTIKDFNVIDDTIHLENTIFTKLTTTGTLNTAFFKANTDGLAKDTNDYLVYETDTGKLFYDTDGNGIVASVQIALIENKALLTYSDFTVI